MSTDTFPKFPWHDIPSSAGNATCKVSLLQAGGLNIPTHLVLLPGPNQPNESVEPGFDRSKWTTFYAPDYVFLIEHTPTKEQYIFDLGIRKDLENLPPPVVQKILPAFTSFPELPAELLRQHGSNEQQPEKVKAVIFSHLHFDHIGDGAKAGFGNAELWLGPTCCTYGRPGYPKDENSFTWSSDLPTDGSRKIVELYVSDELLHQVGDNREGKVAQARKDGLYEAVELKEPNWIGLGAFDRAHDVFGDGSAYLIDAPGHIAGHQIMIIRVKIREDKDDDFVLLAGDGFHHAAVLKEPLRTARPPYSNAGMHHDAEFAIESMARMREFAARDNIWVVAAHDFQIGEAIMPGQKVLKGLVPLNDWREKEWKKDQA